MEVRQFKYAAIFCEFRSGFGPDILESNRDRRGASDEQRAGLPHHQGAGSSFYSGNSPFPSRPIRRADPENSETEELPTQARPG